MFSILQSAFFSSSSSLAVTPTQSAILSLIIKLTMQWPREPYKQLQNKDMIKGIFTTAMTRPRTQVCCFNCQALIKGFRKSSLHIWREVPLTQHKDTGRWK